jgi:NAD(P)-dependent dehydrogenase (short-subunit alcohol dehydrogenase family)
MAFDFDGRQVVVAGGSRGIGRSIALAFARAGAGVSICARGAEDLARTHAEIAAYGRPTHSAACDLARTGTQSFATSGMPRRRSAVSTSWSTMPRPSA